jgi:phosphoglycolate phosphatase-like HAD superfamily hydrolase
VYVGDRPEDEQAAQQAGVPFQWAWNWIEQHQEAIVPYLSYCCVNLKKLTFPITGRR